MDMKFQVSVSFLDTYREHDMQLDFTVKADNINHAWLSAVNYLKSLGLDPDLIEYFSVELL